jgi:hypothetical protein
MHVYVCGGAVVVSSLRLTNSGFRLSSHAEPQVDDDDGLYNIDDDD